MVSCIDRNSFAFFIFPLFLDTLITLLSLALPTLLLRSPSLISSPLSLPLQANRLLWWIQLSHLSWFSHFDDFAAKADILHINIWLCPCIICVRGDWRQGSGKIPVQAVIRKRDRESYRNTALEKSRVSTSFMRKECKARCTPSLPGLSCVEGVRKGGQGDEASEKKFQPVRLWGFLNAS